MYAGDNDDRLPPYYTLYNASPVPPGGIWFFTLLSNNQYITSDSVTNNVWRCPSVQNGDIQTSTVNFFSGNPCEGYGAFQGNTAGNPSDTTNGILRYGQISPSGAGLGSLKSTQLKRPSQIWLIGDVGASKKRQGHHHKHFIPWRQRILFGCQHETTWASWDTHWLDF